MASPSTASELEEIAATTAREAAGVVTAGYGTPREVGLKSSPTDVVTQTDLRAEELVRRLLREATPDAGILGEEGGTTAPEARLQWVIDPLDGTINFLYGVPLFAVSVAAAIAGEIVAGAVVDVLRDEIFSAHKGGGARRDGERITVSACSQLPEALVTTGFSYQAELCDLQGAFFLAVAFPDTQMRIGHHGRHTSIGSRTSARTRYCSPSAFHSFAGIVRV